MKDQFIGIKTKIENKNLINEYRYFLKLIFSGFSTLFLLIYLNRDNDTKQFKTRDVIYKKA